MTTDEIRVDSQKLKEFTRSVFSRAGLTDDVSTVLADGLVTANLRGVDSHGVVRLEPYTLKLERGGFNDSPNLSVTGTRSGTFRVDADDGPGQYATVEAMDRAVERAKEVGAAFAVVENSNHFGTAAYYTERAAESDCIGFAMTNVGPNVAPFGGIDPYFGTNPLAYSIPTLESPTITLDMATSVVAKGKIILAEEEGESIPEEWVLDERGAPTTDPSEFHALRPVGGPKGYGLGLLVDVCSGLLSGMGSSPSVDSLYDDYAKPQRVGHFVGAIDVGAFRDVEAFKGDVETMISELKSQRTAEGVDEVLLPGEPEARIRAERERDGIPLGDGVRETLSEIAATYDLDTPWDG
ncbi:Ldh family oxidoreductase [Haloplanus pelagicus]|jgi:ureidoglycolate dehydrogenase (NAD+)|uniref:Ldh family oxidoreductase n=1 Tax=Haloplanus pelagicus TaxID=2949995 RepID=UPI00203EF3DA|nr:Ldh family oxidoreductase [Haloplanus sp. HW8-1]